MPKSTTPTTLRVVSSETADDARPLSAMEAAQAALNEAQLYSAAHLSQVLDSAHDLRDQIQALADMPLVKPGVRMLAVTAARDLTAFVAQVNVLRSRGL